MAAPLMLLLYAGTAIYSAEQQKNAAKSQQFELERQADQEKLSAEAQEVERRQRLNKVLSANVVSQAMSGTTGEGTPQSLALESAKQSSASEGLNALSDRLRQAHLKRMGANVRQAGSTQATSTLLKGASQVYQGS